VKYARLVLANLGRNKLRTALTGGAIMLAVLLVCVLLTMPAGLDAFLNNIASNTRISVHNKAGGRSTGWPRPARSCGSAARSRRRGG